MLEHPGTELQLLIKEKGLTQKAFASILGKKVSEVNELLKGKRNITIQRDYLLHQTLGTPVKYWILKQVDYDYSLINADETQHQDFILNDSEESREDGKSHKSPLSGEDLSEFSQNNTPSGTPGRIQENTEQADSSDHEGASKGQQKTQTELQETPIQEPKKEIDEDHQKRAKIFKSF